MDESQTEDGSDRPLPLGDSIYFRRLSYGFALGVVSKSLFCARRDHTREENRYKMGKIRRLVLDVLKTHDPSIIELASKLSELSGIDSVNISIYEIDLKVENAKVTLEGSEIDYQEVLRAIGEDGGTVHSIDEAVAGKSIIDDAQTLQDPQGLS